MMLTMKELHSRDVMAYHVMLGFFSFFEFLAYTVGTYIMYVAKRI